MTLAAQTSSTNFFPFLLWPDTFTNHFHPDIARAAVDVLGEFLSKYEPSFSPPRLDHARKALVHGHCHQKALMGMDDEVEWLKKWESILNSSMRRCCGMAGSFGFEKEKYDVSVRCGENGLLPKVREAAPDTLIVANGFSCQEQIEQLTERHALHLSQVMEMALREIEKQPHPETAWIQARNSAVKASMHRSAWVLAGAAALGVAFWASRRKAA